MPCDNCLASYPHLYVPNALSGKHGEFCVYVRKALHIWTRLRESTFVHTYVVIAMFSGV